MSDAPPVPGQSPRETMTPGAGTPNESPVSPVLAVPPEVPNAPKRIVYAVARGHTLVARVPGPRVMLRERTIIQPHHGFDEGWLKKEAASKHGHIEIVGGASDVRPKDPLATSTTTIQDGEAPRDPVTGEKSKTEIKDLVVGQTKKGSPWTFNPEKLRGKQLVELNLLIRERDASVQPFNTQQEAIAWLSADYKS